MNKLLCQQSARPIDEGEVVANKSACDIAEATSKQLAVRLRRVVSGKLAEFASDSRRARKQLKRARDAGYESCLERFYKDNCIVKSHG